MHPISSLVRHFASEGNPSGSTQPLSLDQRLTATHQQSSGSPYATQNTPMTPAEFEWKCMLANWENQIFSPDPDDPSTCATLTTQPSW